MTKKTVTKFKNTSPAISVQKYESKANEYTSTNAVFSTLNTPKEVSIYKISNGDTVILEDKLGQRIVMRIIPKNTLTLSTTTKTFIFRDLYCETSPIDATGDGNYPLTTQGIQECVTQSKAYQYIPTPRQEKLNTDFSGELYVYGGMMEAINIYIIDTGLNFEVVYINLGGPYGEQCANEETKSPECLGAYQYLDTYFNKILQSLKFLK